MRLTDLLPGETGTVVRVNCGRGAKKKLSSRGVKEGSRIRMISSSRGPIIVECGGSQIAIGRGMAGRIEVDRR